METRNKLYVAGGILVVLGGLLAMQRQRSGQEQEAHSLTARRASLPDLKLGADRAKTVDRVVLHKAGAPDTETVELKKTGEESWQLTRPLQATAAASNVQQMVENLGKLELSEAISSTASDYERWGVTAEKALHAQFYAGTETVADLYLGESGSRGQMVRIEGTDGVYTLKGFSKWLYERDGKGFRDKGLFKFDEKAVVSVRVTNPTGRYVFEKDGEAWRGTLAKKTGKPQPIEKFSAAKVDELVRAYKALTAVDFGDGKTAAEAGLDKPEATIVFELTGGTGHYEVKVGGKADGTNRWAVSNGSDQIFSIGSWSADWALAEPSKFQGS
jgi:hypothetical protein